jgi:hypothetical protein
MTKYRARTCPNCDYFLGFSVAQRRSTAKLVPITNFCLNCNYKLPVHSILRGAKYPGKHPRRNCLRLVHGALADASRERAAPASSMSMDTLIGPQNYARHLRVIGQELENFQFDAFNLECSADGYLVWVKSDSMLDNRQPLLGVSKSRLQKLWRGKLPSGATDREEGFTDTRARAPKRLRYTAEDLERMEQERRSGRRPQSRAADGHALSQLLRTVGDFVGRRGERLLGIAWQKLSISIVVETPQGRKEIDIYRPDNLYDLWVRMYLRREDRASSDSPR